MEYLNIPRDKYCKKTLNPEGNYFIRIPRSLQRGALTHFELKPFFSQRDFFGM